VTKNGEKVCQVKGGEKINFKSMKNMLLNELGQKTKIIAEQSVINKNKKNWTICSSIVLKI
jgi:hypothetical protein